MMRERSRSAVDIPSISTSLHDIWKISRAGWGHQGRPEVPDTWQVSHQAVHLLVQSLLHGSPLQCFPMELTPLKIALSRGVCGPLFNTWFLGPTQVSIPNGISIGSAVFVGLTKVTNKQTYRPTDPATPWVAIAAIASWRCDAAS